VICPALPFRAKCVPRALPNVALERLGLKRQPEVSADASQLIVACSATIRAAEAIRVDGSLEVSFDPARWRGSKLALMSLEF